jgi:D12 class N6 adenine-specific DNA methyltransferase
VLRDPQLAAALQRALTLTPPSREEWRACLAAVRSSRADGSASRVGAAATVTPPVAPAPTQGQIQVADVARLVDFAAPAGGAAAADMGWDDAGAAAVADPAPLVALSVDAAAVERARRWYVAVCQSYSKTSTGAAGWAFCRQPNGHIGRKWRHWVEELPRFTRRLAQVQIERMDALKLIALYDAPNVVFYIDPPYLPLSRESPARHGYAHELSQEDHVRLLQTVTRLRGLALVLGYHSPLYDAALAGWRCVEFATYASSATARSSARPRRTGCLWISPRAVIQPALIED